MARPDALKSYSLGAAIILVMVTSGGALAQTDLNAGKSPAQLFATDCAACHRSPQGLARGRDPYALSYFLRDHYTTKPANAGAIAGYLASVRGAAAPRPAVQVPGQEGGGAAGGEGAVGTGRAAGSRPLDRLANATVERLKAFVTSADPAKPSDPGAPERGPAQLAAYAAAGAAPDSLRAAALAAAAFEWRTSSALQGPVSSAVVPGTTAARPVLELRGPPAGSAMPSAQSNEDIR